MVVDVPPSKALHRRDEASILADAIFGDSPALARAVRFIRPHALAELDDEAISRVIEGVCVELVAEVQIDRQYREHLEERNAKALKNRRATLAAMRTLQDELESELDHCLATQRKHDVDLRSDARALRSTVDGLKKSIDAVDGLITLEEAGCTRSAPNSKLFSAEYVRAIRKAWHRITGKPPGIAKQSVVGFALELWEAVGLPDHGSDVTTGDWLAERFKNIR